MDDNSLQERLRAIPAINEILEMEELVQRVSRYGRGQTLKNLRVVLEKIKKEIINKLEAGHSPFTEEDIRKYIVEGLDAELKTAQLKELRKVINASGIVLHTNLGRAPLPDKAVKKLLEVSEGYCNLEYDLEKGRRGARQDQVEELIKEITGAQAAMVVNNNAAAVLLCLQAFAKDKEVLVSRGELVEIGGSFRIPDVITQSGCKLVEVGTTNKTKLSDYKKNINHNTAVILKVHTSNYIIEGFTEAVGIKDLLLLSEKHNLLLVEDLGSGSILDLKIFAGSQERPVSKSLEEGAQLVTFSGDKLLGGPQAGIIIGDKDKIEILKSHPLARAFRCDKLVLSALQAVLNIYIEKDLPEKEIPVLKMLTEGQESLTERARSLEAMIKDTVGDKAQVAFKVSRSEAGGGSLPGVTFDSPSVLVKPIFESAHSWQEKLRKAETPVVVPIEDDGLIFHARTLSEVDMELICKNLKNLI